MLTSVLPNIVISPSATVRQAVEAIDRGAVQVALVVDGDRRLIACVTDGDVRRGLLRGVTLDSPVSEVMRRDPVTIHEREERRVALALMRRYKYHQVPVVDHEGRLIGLQVIDEMIAQPASKSWVVLMAGGLGLRLRPLTEQVPKPMLPVRGRPLLELIVRNLAEQGFRKIFLSVNHLRHVIEDHFGNGDGFGVDIEYLVETRPLGTAGALSLLPERPEKPVIVMNADLMTSIQFNHLLRFHEEHGGDATMCVREHTTQIPFGVVRFEGVRLSRIEEKPIQVCLINAGIYILSPSALDHIPAEQALDMPDFLETIQRAGGSVSVFPLREYWMDIGRMDDLQRADAEYACHFLGTG